MEEKEPAHGEQCGGSCDSRENWRGFLGLGLLLILLGVSVISTSYYANTFSIMLFGAFLIGGGVLQFVQTYLAKEWKGFFISLLLGILYIVTGAMCIARPETAPTSLTLWVAALCLIAGLFRVATSLIMRFEQWRWVLFNGIVTSILGVFIYLGWPLSGLWVIGLFIGIDMILSGWSWVALTLKKT